MNLATLITCVAFTSCVAFTTTTHNFGEGLGGIILPLKLDYTFLIDTTDVTDLSWPLLDKTMSSNSYTLAPPDSAPTMTGSKLGIGWSVDLLADGPSTETTGHVCYLNLTDFKRGVNTYRKWITVAMQETAVQVSHAEKGVALDIKSFCLGAHKNATIGPGTFCSQGIFEIKLTLDSNFDYASQPETGDEKLALLKEHVRDSGCPGIGK
jgi:hypothetical protein